MKLYHQQVQKKDCFEYHNESICNIVFELFLIRAVI